MRIIVTGGIGFIGSHLCAKLLKMGHNVICIDNNFSGSFENIQDLRENENFLFKNRDIIDPFDYLEIKMYRNVSKIYHLACPASPKAYQENPIKTLKTNFIGTMNILELARKIHAQILFTSTSEIYGDPTINPQHENYWGNVNPIGIRACYDEGKRIGETLMIEYKRKYKIDIKIARIFNTYGPKMKSNDGRVVSNFITQCLDDKNMTIYGNGDQTRSFCYVDDTVQALILLMESRKYIGPVNIGNPKEMTIKNLALVVKMLTKSKSKLIYKDLPLDDPKRRKPCIKKAKEYLDWEPKIELKDGLLRTIYYFMNK